MLSQFVLIAGGILVLMLIITGWDLLLNKIFTNKWFGEE